MLGMQVTHVAQSSATVIVVSKTTENVAYS